MTSPAGLARPTDGVLRQTWTMQGRFLQPDDSIRWMRSHTGASFAVPTGRGAVVDLYVSGRDGANRSMIGRVRVDLDDPHGGVEVEPEPVLEPGELGAFDENGVSYPCLVHPPDGRVLLLYTGWMPSVLTPFQNHIGLAVQRADGSFERVSRAPVLERTDEDHLAMGSCFARVEGGIWHLWYTSWLSWGTDPSQPPHRYGIKHAWSTDGLAWHRDGRVVVPPASADEHSTCRPSVLTLGDTDHLWFCWRGEHYRLGYATSLGGSTWQRRDDALCFDREPEAWESRGRCYPHVIRIGTRLYLLYSGNGYGRDGLGLATLDLSA